MHLNTLERQHANWYAQKWNLSNIQIVTIFELKILEQTINSTLPSYSFQ